MNQTPDNQIAADQPLTNIKENQDPIAMMMEARDKRLRGENIAFDANDYSNNESNEDIYSDIKFEENPESEKSDKSERDKPENEKSVKSYSEEEFNKIQSRLNENRNYSHNVNKKLTSVTNMISELLQNGDLSEEHADSLFQVIKNNEAKKPEGLTESSAPSSDPFQKFIDIANPSEIENYVNYTADEQYIDKIKAYNHFMYQEATAEEKKQIYAELSELEKSPPRLVKKMMEIGDNFLKEGYDEFLQSGSIRKYIQINKEKLSNKEREVDKIIKNKVKSDYDEPTYGFEQYSSNFAVKDKKDVNGQYGYDSDSPISQALKARDKRLESQRRK